MRKSEVSSLIAALPMLTGGDPDQVLCGDGVFRVHDGGGGISDGDKGDVVVAGGGTSWTVPDLALKANASSLAAVATSGDAADLVGTLDVDARVADGTIATSKLATPPSGLSLTEHEVDLGAVPRGAGTFDITGLANLGPPGRQVVVAQKAAAYTGKGDQRDEAEMDAVIATGYVVDSSTIRVYWVAVPGPISGAVKFGYAQA